MRSARSRGNAVCRGSPIWRTHDGALARHPCRVVAAIAFLTYGAALPQISIWYRRSWATTVKSLFDSAIDAAVTGAAFGWLWPQ
jgi:hypothetical protein